MSATNPSEEPPVTMTIVPNTFVLERTGVIPVLVSFGAFRVRASVRVLGLGGEIVGYRVHDVIWGFLVKISWRVCKSPKRKCSPW